MQDIPPSFYVIVGTLVLANIGSLVSVFYGVGKIIWFLARLESRVSVLEIKTAKDIDAAYVAIRDLQTAKSLGR